MGVFFGIIMRLKWVCLGECTEGEENRIVFFCLKLSASSILHVLGVFVCGIYDCIL